MDCILDLKYPKQGLERQFSSEKQPGFAPNIHMVAHNHF